MMARRIRIALGWTAACVVLAAVFALYARPETMVQLGELMWACFN